MMITFLGGKADVEFKNASSIVDRQTANAFL